MFFPCNNSFSKLKYLEDDENCCSNGLLGSYKLELKIVSLLENRRFST